MADINPIPILNNSRKISQIRGRDTMTYHQEHSWLVMAQYNDKIAAYHNVAINLSAITSYSIAYSNANTEQLVDNAVSSLVLSYDLEGFKELAYIGQQTDYDGIAYALENSRIGSNIVAYTHSYTLSTMMWEYYPSFEETFSVSKYLLTENGTHLLTDKSKKILV